MHIGLNAHLLSSSSSYRAAGISWYILSLLQHLSVAADQHRFTAFLGDKAASGSFPGIQTMVAALPTARPTARIVWEQLIQPVQLLRARVDLLHSMAFVQPVVLPCPGVVTIYDLSFFLFPESFESGRRMYLKWGTAYSARQARRVVAISESTKRDIVRLLGVPDGKVDVVACGVDEDFRPVEESRVLDELRKKRNLPPQMLLFVGTIEPRKNLVTLLEAYSVLKARVDPPPLVIVGPKGWRNEEVLARAEKLQLVDDVLFPGYIPRDELPLWYNAAEVFVYPSLYEGFGLPPLEAMACGTPVVVSDTSALPEVVGDAGLLVEPSDAEGMALAMQRALTDRDLRRTLRKNGLERARRYTWRRAAQDTVKVYDRAVADDSA